MTASIILRDPSARPVHVLECDGPPFQADVNHSPRLNLRTLSFQEWLNLPEHDRNPRSRHPRDQDQESAARIARLVDAYPIPLQHKREILARLELLHPGCTGWILPTAQNLQST